jgi:hypothetical protein
VQCETRECESESNKLIYRLRKERVYLAYSGSALLSLVDDDDSQEK